MKSSFTVSIVSAAAGWATAAWCAVQTAVSVCENEDSAIFILVLVFKAAAAAATPPAEVAAAPDWSMN